MAEETKDIVLKQEDLQQMNVAMKTLLAKQDEYGKQSAEFKKYFDAVDKNCDALKKLDDFNNQQVAKIAAEEKKNAELLDRIKHLETSAGMLGQQLQMTPGEKKELSHKFMTAFFKKGGTNQTLTDGGMELAQLAQEHPQYWNSYCESISRKSLEGITGLPLSIKAFQQKIELEKKASAGGGVFRTDIGEFGGFLPSIEWSNELKSNIFEKTPMRQFCTVKQIGGKTLRQPITTGIPQAYDEGETQIASGSTPAYAMVEITPYRIHSLVPVTWDALQDSYYNVSEEIMDKVSQAFGVTEGTNCVKGNGIRRALGFVNDPNIIPYTSAVAATGNTNATANITFDDLIAMTGMLKTGYNPMFFFSRTTAAYLRAQKDNQGRYLWNEMFGSAVAGLPAQINGYSYTNQFIDMDPVTTTGGHPVLFADMKEYYQITDRSDMILIRDEYTQATAAIINFNLMRWTTGQPIKSEAAVLMTRNN